MKRNFTLKVFLLHSLVFLSNSGKADWDLLNYFPSERLDSAGNSGRMFLDGFEGAVLNPARPYASAPQWVLRLPYLSASATMIEFIQKKGIPQQIEFLEKHVGESMTVKVNADISYATKDWALGFIYQESNRGILFLDLNRFGLETIEVNARRTFGVSGSYRYNLNERFSTGVSAKFLRRDVRNIEAALTDFGAVTDLKNIRNLRIGYGFALDAAFLYQEEPEFGPRLGLIFRQIGDTKIRRYLTKGDLLETIPQSIDFASGYRLQLPSEFKLDLSFDINDIISRLETNFIKRTHAGLGLNWRAYNIYTGLNGGYVCYGVKMTHGFFTLDLGTIGFDSANRVGVRQDRRYYLGARYSF